MTKQALRSKMPLMNHFISVVLLLLAVPLVNSTDYKEELRQVESYLEQAKKKKKSLSDKEKGILEVLAEIDERINEVGRKILQLKKNEEILEKELEYLKGKKSSYDIRVEQCKDLFGNRISLTYKYGLMVSKNDLVYMQHILSKDKNNLVEMQCLIDSLKGEKTKLGHKLTSLLKIRKEQESERQKMLKEKIRKDQILKEVRSEKTKQYKLVMELEAAQLRLEQLISELSKHKEIYEFEEIIWPVHGQIVSRFGEVRDPEYGTRLVNNGINIKVDFGMPVRAVFHGEVAYAERFLGYGNLIIIDHENGFYTLYGHLSDILVSKGEMVEKGEIIGKVGSPSSTLESSLYFEIRENGRAIDPLKILK